MKKLFYCKTDKTKVKPNQPSLSSADTKEGFTIIEVMLTLAITGLMLVGLLGGSFNAIAHQRYNDSLRDFAEYLSRMYSEALSPETFGVGSSSQAVLGKILVFGYDYGDADDNRAVYSATLVGSTDINRSSGEAFFTELADPSTALAMVCGNNSGQSTSVERYLPLWDAELTSTTDAATPNERFRGTIIIARTPTSGTIHTIYTPDFSPNLRDNCRPDNNSANTNLKDYLAAELSDGTHSTFANSLERSTGICVKSDNSSITREIEITADGGNTSAVLTLSEEDSLCE